MAQYKRRNPFDEYGYEEYISVYLKSDVETKAVAIWGSLDNIAAEKEKRRWEYEKRKQAVFNYKKSLRDYQNRIERLENPLMENRYVTIFSVFLNNYFKLTLDVLS